MLIANEIPFMPIQRHFPTLSHYDGKGFFLIFVSTYIFSASATWRQTDLGAEQYLGWLTDLCALALFVKGIICLLLWVGKHSCCPKCCQAEAESIAGTETGV